METLFRMKNKALTVLIMASMILAVVGCAGGSGGSSVEETPIAATPTEDTTPDASYNYPKTETQAVQELQGNTYRDPNNPAQYITINNNMTIEGAHTAVRRYLVSGQWVETSYACTYQASLSFLSLTENAARFYVSQNSIPQTHNGTVYNCFYGTSSQDIRIDYIAADTIKVTFTTPSKTPTITMILEP